MLSGHTRNVRALHWHKELEWLAMSGAWDGTIRLWDTRTCACVRVIAEHHADIYCLVSHPARPFALLSTSRDTTVRTWFLDDAATPLLLPVLLGDEVGTVRGVAGDVPLGQIYRGVMPFVAADLVRLVILTLFPVLSLGLLAWL